MSIYGFLKRRLYARYNHRIDNPADRKKSAFFSEWIDVGFLRHRWTNDGQIAEGVFRSNNPDEKRFAAYAEKGIRTVVNLRNDIERAPSKFAEEFTQANGMEYVSFPMLPREAPSKQQLLDLIELFPKLEKPILFHCKSGADRTGLVAAIWQMTQEGKSLAAARSELSLRYIHRRDSETGVLDEVLDAYEKHQNEMGFKEWVKSQYDPAAVETLAAENKPSRGFWGTLKYFYRDVYTYGQYREALWHDSFAVEIATERDKTRAEFFMKWVDHGVLRGIWKNFHEISTGVFRSNHPTESRFRAYAKDGFKSVINLRGASMQPQYQLEKSLCQELGLELIDIGMEGSVAPSKATLLALLDTFGSAQKPMIIHCKSGADRTGLASALYLISQGETVETARNQLSLRYIHLRNGSKGILGWVVDQYAVESAIHDVSLRDWVKDFYQPEQLTKGFHALRVTGSFPAHQAPSEHIETCKKIAVVTSVRNDTSFLDRWISYYGSKFGNHSLFVILDGFDQPVPDVPGVNFIRVPYIKRSVVAGDKARAARASNLAETLFRTYDLVIGTDVDEFICVDPNVKKSLAEYLSALKPKGPISPLGLDVAQHLSEETVIERGRSFLSQRSYAKISDRYTKASILNAPLRWGSGFHRVRGENYEIDPNLFLFHFGSVDKQVSQKRATDVDRVKEGWTAHQKRRDTLFDEITNAVPVDGDSRFSDARIEMSKRRQLYAWNKPSPLREKAIVKIPERFKNVV